MLVLVPSLTGAQCHSMAPSLLPELLLATKEVNERTRHVAFDLLVAIGRRLRDDGKLTDWQTGGQTENEREREAHWDCVGRGVRARVREASSPSDGKRGARARQSTCMYV
jgi:hypothetical protein